MKTGPALEVFLRAAALLVVKLGRAKRVPLKPEARGIVLRIDKTENSLCPWILPAAVRAHHTVCSLLQLALTGETAQNPYDLVRKWRHTLSSSSFHFPAKHSVFHRRPEKSAAVH